MRVCLRVISIQSNTMHYCSWCNCFIKLSNKSFDHHFSCEPQLPLLELDTSLLFSLYPMTPSNREQIPSRDFDALFQLQIWILQSQTSTQERPQSTKCQNLILNVTICTYQRHYVGYQQDSRRNLTPESQQIHTRILGLWQTWRRWHWAQQTWGQPHSLQSVLSRHSQQWTRTYRHFGRRVRSHGHFCQKGRGTCSAYLR